MTDHDPAWPDPGWFVHDPMCWFNPSLPSIRPCICELLAKTRADERERIAQAIEKCGTQDSAGVFWIWVDAAARIARDGGGNG